MSWYGWYICGLLTAPTLIVVGMALFSLWGCLLNLIDWIGGKK